MDYRFMFLKRKKTGSAASQSRRNRNRRVMTTGVLKDRFESSILIIWCNIQAHCDILTRGPGSEQPDESQSRIRKPPLSTLVSTAQGERSLQFRCSGDAHINLRPALLRMDVLCIFRVSRTEFLESCALVRSESHLHDQLLRL